MLPSLYPENFRANTPPKPRRTVCRKVSQPRASVSPHVRLVFAEMARLNVGYQDVENFSGVRRATCKAWRQKNAPSLESLTAVLSFLGYDYVPVPALEALPPDFAGEITALALRMQHHIPTTWAAVVSVGVEQALLKMSIDEKRSVLEARSARGRPPANDNAKSAT